MPNTKSAKKRLRQSLERRTRNRSVKSALHTYTKRVRQAAEAGQVDQAQDALRVATKKLDQAAAKGVIHANKAARVKSRLARLIRAKKQPA